MMRLRVNTGAFALRLTPAARIATVASIWGAPHDMPRTNEEIKTAFGRERRRAFLSNIGVAGGIAIAISIACLFGGVYWYVTPTEHLGVWDGRIVGSYQLQTKAGNSPVRVSVRLEDGQVFSVPLPQGVMLRQDAKVQIEIRRRLWWPHSVQTSFRKYEADVPAPP